MSVMHVRLIAVGKVRERYIADALADFRARLRPYHRFEEIEVRAADGADPVRAMRAEGPFQSTPVIVISTDATSNRIHAMQALGAVGYLQKPFGPEQLRNELDRVLGVVHE